MGTRQESSVATTTGRNVASRSVWERDDSYGRLSTGLRIVPAAEDPAGLGGSERLRARIHHVQSGRRGADLVSLMQGALDATGCLLKRLS
jgi:flagellin-like hook-associated protein FlgL